MRLALRTSALVCALCVVASGVAAQEAVSFGRFSVTIPSEGEPTTVYLDGPVERDSANTFEEVLSDYPSLSELVLDSEGGDLESAILIADLTFGFQLDTTVPSNASCWNECVMIFLAGAVRTGDGDFAINGDMFESYDFFDSHLRFWDAIDRLDLYGASDDFVLMALDLSADQPAVQLSEADLAALGLTRATPAENLDPLRLIATENQLDGLCRGSVGFSLLETACVARNYYLYLLGEQGVCYGRQSDRASPDARWHRCEEGSTRFVRPD